ncbi:ATP-grasp domain-containing protein [Streptomyces sp. V2]|uniref:pyridoxal-phosphate dependent enzyme n=1 Tax=Streptomyces TaxID=1883 RepID=UPI0006EB4102|nr:MULTISPECIES: pyridoxal-phosphate dependent enzyme [Streptomyces]PWG12229.1 ATP-grasp domain-containing protein [Streptomyces sp. V2]
MLFESVTAAIGHTPVIRAPVAAADGVETYLKLEFQNLYGMKDRVARNIITEARRRGTLAEGAPIIESSSGTMALGVALVGAALGHRVHIVTDPRIDRVTLAKLRALGCEVHIVDAMTGKGWQSARLELLHRLRADLPGAFWPDQYENPDNPAAYRLLAAELTDDLGEFDVLVGSVGSGGSLCGTARALKDTLPGLRVVGVDSVGSVLFGQPDRPGRRQSGLGNSLMPGNLDRRLIHEVHWLNDREALSAARELAREQQIFAGNTSGSVYRVVRHLAARAEPGTRIVGILPDRGDRYADTIYDDGYWAAEALDAQTAAPAPATISARSGQTAETWSKAEDIDRSQNGQRLLFIESNTTGTGMLALGLTRDLGPRPVLLTNDPGRYRGLTDTGADVLTCDTNALPALRETILREFRREQIAGITTTSDFYLTATAELAAWLGLPGSPVDAVARCRDKSRTRHALRDAGLHQPRSATVTTDDEVATAVARTGLPCVTKPVDDSGSNHVLLCTTPDQVRAQVRRILAEETNVRGQSTAGAALIEEYLDGPEYSVETITRHGETRCVGIVEKHLTGHPHFVEHRHVFPAPLAPADAHALTDTVRRALDAVGLTDGTAHTEVRLTQDGPVVIEINGRPAGGMIPELIRLTTGLTLQEQQLRIALGLRPHTAAPPDGVAVIQFLLTDRAGTLARVDGVEAARAVDAVRQVVVTAVPGQPVQPARNAYHRLGHVISWAPTADEATAACAKAHAELTVVLEEPHPR